MSVNPELSAFHPHDVDDLVRLGRLHDGGYVVSERTVRATDCLVGLGINQDWSFESAFMESAPRSNLIAVDGTVSFNRFLIRAAKSVIRGGLHLSQGSISRARYEWAASREFVRTASAFHRFFKSPQRRFLGDMMRERSGIGALTWNDLLQRVTGVAGSDGRLFVKMDIEGAEYRVLKDFLADCDRVVGLVVEFHDCDLHWERLVELVSALTQQFAVVHIHGNNCEALIAGSTVPRVLEISFARRTLLSERELRAKSLRSYPVAGLDWPNDPRREDYVLRFETATPTTIGTIS